MGVSADKAFKYLEGSDSDTVIVAILDNGAELTHDDLQGTFWINIDEIPDNGIDDDNNGYIDDINGWNFLGNAQNENLKRDTKALTRIYGELNKQFKGKEQPELLEKDSVAYQNFLEIEKAYKSSVKETTDKIKYFETLLKDFEISDEIIKKKLKKEEYTFEELQKIKRPKGNVAIAVDFMKQLKNNNLSKASLVKRIGDYQKDLETRLNPDFKNRENIVGDDPNDLTDTDYGNNQLNVKGPYHGTSMAGVIGAVRNDFGVNGIAKKVKLMILRIVPNGDERDKDIALAIRYAIENGAQIINCSFAKAYSMHHDWIQELIPEIEKAGVLVVQGAGNSGTNNDEKPYFPTGRDLQGEKSTNWIIAGASLPDDNENWVAYFSNYGKTSVDVFAPGYKVGSCKTGNKYDQGSGTSIAAPVICGTAAVLKSYYPFLTGQQIKEILLESAHVPKTEKVNRPGPGPKEKVKVKDIAVKGGVVNLYRAVLLVEEKFTRSIGEKTKGKP